MSTTAPLGTTDRTGVSVSPRSDSPDGSTLGLMSLPGQAGMQCPLCQAALRLTPGAAVTCPVLRLESEDGRECQVPPGPWLLAGGGRGWMAAHQVVEFKHNSGKWGRREHSPGEGVTVVLLSTQGAPGCKSRSALHLTKGLCPLEVALSHTEGKIFAGCSFTE